MEGFFVEFLVRGVVLCLLTALALILCRRIAAAYRHLLCVLALCGLLILPLAQRLMPPLRLLNPLPVETPKPVTVPTEVIDIASANNPRSALPQPPEFPQKLNSKTKPSTLIPSDSAPNASIEAPVKPISRQNASKAAVAAVLLAIWGLGSSILLIRLLVALLRLRRLEAESRKATFGSVPIVVSEQVKTPLTWGIRRNVILLPAALLSDDPAICESALRHEQAHIKRQDWVWNLLAEIVCTLCWFQPGAWWLRRRMRLESERACDDLALLSGITGPDYAAHLLQILKSGCSREVAPAMAQSGRMEERMKHILDTKKPRRVKRKWLVLASQLGLVLVSVAALRVSARPAEVKHLIDPNSSALKTRRSVMSRLPTISADPEHSPQSPPFGSIDNNGGAAKEAPLEKPGTSNRPDTTQVNGSPAAALDNVRSAITLKNAAWGKAVDGLEPGFLLNTPGLPNQVVPFNTQISYQVLVRNTSGQDRTFTVHCKDFSEMDPYLIPGGEIHKALGGSKIPENYHAIGVIEEVKWFPAYIVKLAPGETVVVPNELGLYVGSADKQNFPRIEQVKMGMNWIVQPIAIHRLTAAELVQTDGSKTNVTIVDRGGKTVQRSVPSVIAKSGGKQFYAKIRLELTPGRTTAQTKPAVDDGIAWGREWNGLQLGLRLPKGVRTFSALSQARFEVVLHNRSDKPTQLSWMGYPTIEQFSPELFTPDGKPINFNLTIAGPYVQQATKLAAGETVALGTISLPQDLRTVLDSLPAGPYLTSGPPPPSSYQAAFSLDVTLPNGKKDIVHTSHIKFTVQRPDIASRGSARRENHSIIPAVANPQADNRPVTVNPNPPSSRSSKSVDLSYKPGARALRDRTLAGQSQSVNAVAFSPDSRRVVTGSADGTAIVWEVTTGRRLLTLSSRTAAISSAIYAPSGKIIITGCADGAIHIWDTATGNRLATIIRYRVGAVRALDISADGTKIGCGYENGAVCVWAASSGKKLAEFDYNNRLLSVAIANDGKLIAAGYTDATLKAWDIQTQQSVFSTKNPQSEGVTGLHFDTQGYLYTFDREETLYHEETHSGKWKVSSMTIRGFRGLEKAGEIKGIINFQIPDGVISQSVQTIPDGVISQSAQAMSYDDMKMVFGLSEGQAAFNNMTGGQVTLNAHEGPVAAVAISPDGAWVATGGRRNGRGEAKIWDIKAHKPIKMAK